jgi:hypothetical protein
MGKKHDVEHSGWSGVHLDGVRFAWKVEAMAMKTMEELEAILVNMDVTLSAQAARQVVMAAKLDQTIHLANGLQEAVDVLKRRVRGFDSDRTEITQRLAFVEEQAKAGTSILMRLRDGLR